ncbi:pimeloyl-ACP methyl ester carboxylesterase [Aquimarina sp. EL_43]|uniref:alpha/beta fold hydrolase n=1 Tax=unclassified Aquimarina TaxID=2627091 RepID=UPI0018CA62D5|nr:MULTISPECIES: alpha/beta fold hydrolase [unclassified Aquimarina]MBG6132862.1 pimeloyl-ACP methyl ester carboxylesterase [Aquimarina sp. EL_35]MBG6153061.1 pimeloyl-ACP methyl ester carboxylesterase [Aquimarina sp. EL_32]MBG6171217.1 pimeloyl-ACP methyl ester carboxylesterase [Aquimarina sp. EL_43]
MNLFKKTLKVTGIILVVLLIGLFIFLLIISPGSTPIFKDEQGDSIKSSIAEMKHIPIGGIEQFVLIRGKNIANPILLVLHGGPGATETPMFRKHNSDLEEHYTVVYWDQRGSGKSTISNIPTSTFTLDRFIEDTNEVTKYLKKRFKKDKIFLLGHSWGSLLGISTVYKYPNDYHAYIGTGQIGNVDKNEQVAYRFALKKVTEDQDTIAINRLKKIGGFTNRPIDKDLLKSRMYVSKYGSLYKENSVLDVFVTPILYNKEYTISDKYNAITNGTDIEAIIQSPVFNLFETVFKTDLTKTIEELKVPVYFLQGKHDYLTNYDIAKEYFDVLKAPKKTFITFYKSAHFPPFEEPKKFNDFMINNVLIKNSK